MADQQAARRWRPLSTQSGAVLLEQRALGDSTVLLHLTLGEGGNPKMSPAQCGEQKRREAQWAAALLGARVIFGPYRDGELPNTEDARRYVAEVFREVKPTLVITHWRDSIHRDHASTHAIEPRRREPFLHFAR